MKLLYALIAFVGLATKVYAQQGAVMTLPASSKKDSTLTQTEKKKAWYETFAIRGYVQIRYNRLLETNPNLRCDQCDKSWGDQGGFFMRRARVVMSGNISEKVYMYIQTDFASSASATALHFGQIRDAYFDLALDDKKDFRVRIGQSKVIYGFDNMQSSQTRLSLDRSDALNSAVPNERDMGVTLLWTPERVRHVYSSLVADGLKSTGDYGVLGVAVYNGQTANRPELNNQQHVAARVTYPFALKNKQVVELSLQGYTGQYVLPSDLRSAGVKTSNADFQFADERVAASFILYPKPFGIQAEYNIGRGPEFNKATQTIETRSLDGGYVTASYLIKKGKRIFIPYLRLQNYNGGKKLELDARSYRVKELEVGLEWQPYRNFELTAAYTISERRYEDFKTPENIQSGRLLRLQAQLNF